VAARRLAIGCSALLGAAALAFTGRELRLSAFEAAQASDAYEDVYYLPPAPWLPVLGLGYGAALADLLWCKSLVYFGEGMAHRAAVQHVFAYTDALIALDPTFRSAYTWVATAAMFRPQQADYRDGLRAAVYLERAVERWPTDGELRWDLGSLLRFDVAPLIEDRALKDDVLQRAAPHLDAAARLGAGPPWLVLNNASLFERLGRVEQAIRHLEEAYATVSDDDVRAAIAQRLARLRATAYIEAQRAGQASPAQGVATGSGAP
jgi:tetratricopeptide (TPR) repeat protein